MNSVSQESELGSASVVSNYSNSGEQCSQFRSSILFFFQTVNITPNARAPQMLCVYSFDGVSVTSQQYGMGKKGRDDLALPDDSSAIQ